MASLSPVITLLRNATARAHRDIEDLLQLGRPDLDPTRYTQALAGFARFLPAWEARVMAALPPRLRPWFAERSRLHFLERDVASLRLSIGQDAVSLPELPSLAAAWGSMYVMEGSALGGQVIARQAAQQLSLGPDGGAAYFNGWGSGAALRWREFQERLEAEIGPHAGDHAAACEAAVKTFDALAAVFRATRAQTAGERGCAAPAGS